MSPPAPCWATSHRSGQMPSSTPPIPLFWEEGVWTGPSPGGPARPSWLNAGPRTAVKQGVLKLQKVILCPQNTFCIPPVRYGTAADMGRRLCWPPVTAPVWNWPCRMTAGPSPFPPSAPASIDSLWTGPPPLPSERCGDSSPPTQPPLTRSSSSVLTKRPNTPMTWRWTTDNIKGSPSLG